MGEGSKMSGGQMRRPDRVRVERLGSGGCGGMEDEMETKGCGSKEGDKGCSQEWTKESGSVISTC